MVPEAAIRLVCGTVCAAAAVYGSYKFYKFYQKVVGKFRIIQAVQTMVEQLSVGDAELEGDQLRDFMIELDAVRDLLEQVALDFGSVSEESLLGAYNTVSKMFIKYNIAQV